MSRRNNKSSSSKNLNAEVQALLRKSRGKLTQNDLNQLTKKYNNRELAQKFKICLFKNIKKLAKNLINLHKLLLLNTKLLLCLII